ncbi:MAG: FAD-dependent urate hydroxylase HpxO [Synechococcales cyanobacterium]
MQNLRVVVIGAGIGGLTAGLALHQAGYAVDIYDRVQELRPVGAGISLWSNGVKVLNRLGLGSQIQAIGGTMQRMQYRDKSGALLNDISLDPLIQAVGQRPYPVARRDLQQMLLEAFPGSVHLGHECVAVAETDSGVIAQFANGHRVEGDVLVAADGIRSRVRQYVLGEDVSPQYGGYVNWNGLVPASEDLAPLDSWVIYVGDHQRVSLMPVGGERFYFFFDVPLPPGTVGDPQSHRHQLQHYFQGWADPVQRLLERLDPATIARPEIHDLGPIPTYVRGRVALLGDAAHATCPDLGQGGCQAMEDAWVLAQYLLTTTLSVTDALQRYDRERTARANAVVMKARQRAEQIHGRDPAVTQAWYEQLAHESPLAVTDAIAKVILAGALH